MTQSHMSIGSSETGDLRIDLPKLLETRMLVQSNSGGGKSWALRRLLERTAPAAQQIIIDVEGEFTTLREKFDYIVGLGERRHTPGKLLDRAEGTQGPDPLDLRRYRRA